MADVMCVFVQWILRCKCRIVNWKYVTVGVGRLYFDMADGVCVCVCVWSVDTEM